jgi:hypothetical protein
VGAEAARPESERLRAGVRKEIARIERNEIEKAHAKTREAMAARLGVRWCPGLIAEPAGIRRKSKIW